MRSRKLAVILFCLALFSATTFSVTGQQDALPRVQPRVTLETPPADSNAPLPTVQLATDTLPQFEQPTLAEAARNNDFVTFDALYTAMQQSGQRVAEWSALHDLWSWSMSDPIGGFYGRDIYTRLSRAYPGFSDYINQYVIVDSNGNSFWPASETRQYLIDQAMKGNTSKLQIADALPRVTTRTTTTTTPRATRPARSASGRSSAGRSRTVLRKNGVAKKAAPKPVATTPAATTPAVTTPAVEPPVAAPTTPASESVVSHEPAPAVATEPTPSPAPVQVAQAESTPPATAPATQARAPAPAAAVQQDSFPTGIVMLLLLALFGIGLFAMIMRTPKEERMPMIVDPKPPAPVEPLRKAAGQHEARGSGSLESVEPPPHSPSSPDRSHHDGAARGLRR